MLIDILDDLLYTVFKPNFECFRKVRYFAKFLVDNMCFIPYNRHKKAGIIKSWERIFVIR